MRNYSIIPLLLLFYPLLLCQEIETNSNTFIKTAFAKVYGNFHTDITPHEHTRAFEIRRAYLGYKHELNHFFTGEVKLDIGSPDDVSPYSLIRRYAYFKTAGIAFSKNNSVVKFGIIDLYQFKIQEKYWRYRYIKKSFQDEFSFGSSADIGISVKHRLASFISLDLTVMNGEGYKNLQSDDVFKYGSGVTFWPVKGLIARTYIDYMHDIVSELTIANFIGYEYNNKLVAGVEYNLKLNNNFNKNHHLNGFSGYMSYAINNLFEIFGRYDRLTSNIVHDETNPWNIVEDGSAIIAGIQYSPISEIKMALNYQDWYPYAANLENRSYIFINVEFVL